jgi:hypothetical protein
MLFSFQTLGDRSVRLLALLAYGLIALLLLLGLGLYGLLSQLDLEALTEAGDEALREHYALTLSVSKESSLTLFPEPSVVLRDAELRGLDAPDAPPLAQVGELALTVDLQGALKGARAPVRGIALRDVEIALDPASLAGGPSASKGDGVQAGDLEDGLTLTLPTLEGFPVQRMELANVTLHLAASEGRAPVALEGLEGALVQEGNSLALRLAGALTGGPDSFPIALETRLFGDERQLSAETLTLQLGSDRLQGTALLRSEDGGRRLESALTLSGPTLHLDPLVVLTERFADALAAGAPTQGKTQPTATPLQAHHWHRTVEAKIEALHFQQRTLGPATLTLDLDAAGGSGTLSLSRFLKGKANARYVYTSGNPGALRLQAENLAPEAWDPRLRGLGALALQGAFIEDSNAAFGLRGTLALTGASGSLETSALKAPLSLAALLLGDQSAVARWPERLRYGGLTGDLTLGAKASPQPFTLAIDDLSLAGALQLGAKGTTLSAEGRFAPGGATFPVPKALRDVPLPLRCPKLEAGLATCELDRPVFLNALRQGEGKALRNALEAAAEEKLPDALKGPARALLRGLFQKPRDGGGR